MSEADLNQAIARPTKCPFCNVDTCEPTGIFGRFALDVSLKSAHS
jgi:hypothetical protein